MATGRNIHDGILLIDKDPGETSHDVVKKVRRFFPSEKVGHAGTLDPFASGLLILLIGQGTKLFPYLMIGRKKYSAKIRLGIETNTFDRSGEITRESPIPRLKKEEIKEVIHTFTGEIEQIPPVFSAVRHNGVRAYELARKGVNVELKKRQVTIHSISMISIDLPEIMMEITCSHGTYIRSLAFDIGKRLGSGAHLSSLRRLSSEPFQVEDAISSRRLVYQISGEQLIENLLSLKDALPYVREISVDTETACRLRDGQKQVFAEINQNGLSDNFNGLVKVTNDSSLVAIMEIGPRRGDEHNRLKKIRIFN